LVINLHVGAAVQFARDDRSLTQSILGHGRRFAGFFGEGSLKSLPTTDASVFGDETRGYIW